MNREQIKPDLERRFLIQLIMNPAFARQAAALVHPATFPSAYANLIAKWCKEFTTAHGEAPKKAIVAVYNEWLDKDGPPEDEAAAVHDLLEGLSEEFDNPEFDQPENPAHAIEQFVRYTNRRQAAKIVEDAGNLLQMHDDASAIEMLRSFRMAEADGGDDDFDMLSNNGTLSRTFAEPQESIIEWPDAADDFIGRECTRGAFIGIQAPGKRGKTYMAMEFIYRAIRNRRKVAFFECGDLSMEEVMRRFYARICRKPLYPANVKIPTSLELIRTGAEITPKVEFIEKRIDAFDQSQANSALAEFHRRRSISSKRRYIMGRARPANTISVTDIDNRLKFWRDRDGFVPDVIIIDYADILAPEPGTQRETFRDRINHTWKAIRRLAQTWHACVISPTQGDAGSYIVKTQSTNNFADDNRKLTHVTGMLGMNQMPDEKEQQVMRLNWIVRRHQHFNINQCLYVTQCLPLGMALCQCAI